MINEYLGQFFSILAPIFIFISYQLNKDKQVLMMNLFASLSLCIGYLLLGAITGFWLLLVAVIRCILFIVLRDGSLIKKISAWIIIAATIALGIYSWQGWSSVIAIIGMAVNAFFLSLGNPDYLRKSVLFTSPCLLIYNCVVFSLGGIINETMGIISSVIGIVRFHKATISPVNQTKKILFIGNSYTYFNESWNIFKNIAMGQGKSVEVYSVTEGGYTLEQMANPCDEFGEKVDKILNEIKFDAVFLQDQSTRPLDDKDSFTKSIIALNKKIKKNGANVYLFQTWGRHNDSPQLIDLGESNKTMTIKLRDAYCEVAKKIGATVSPVGSAFYVVNTSSPEIEIYHEDKSHPSYLGSYLVALTHYATLFNEMPFNVNYKATDDGRTQEYLEKAVITAVFSPETIYQ